MIKIKMMMKRHTYLMERHMNRAERRQRHKYTKYKKCLGKVILKCIKPFLPVFPFDLPENIRKIWY